MPIVPIASFLAGSLLSLLLPTLMLIGLVIWHFRVAVRAEKPGEQSRQAQVPVGPEDVSGAPERTG
jgi:hypothetical protein